MRTRAESPDGVQADAPKAAPLGMTVRGWEAVTWVQILTIRATSFGVSSSAGLARTVVRGGWKKVIVRDV
jgi:hypothetical protein